MLNLRDLQVNCPIIISPLWNTLRYVQGLYSQGKSGGNWDFKEGQGKSGNFFYGLENICFSEIIRDFLILLKFSGTFPSFYPHLLFVHDKWQYWYLILMAIHF